MSGKMPVSPHLTVDEWEQKVGDSVRHTRLSVEMGQADLADRADVSLKTIGNLEHGRGSSLSTLIRVAQALDRTDWLEGLTQPTPVIEPTALPGKPTTPPDKPNPRPRSRRWRAPSSD